MGFSNISKQRVLGDRVVPLVLNQLVGDPVLHVRYLGESNAPFWSDVIARANTSAALGQKRKDLSFELIAENRGRNREVVAKYAVAKLEGFMHDPAPDADGVMRAKPATEADIPAVVASLPDDVFDSVLQFVSNPDHFRDYASMGDHTAIAGK